MSDDGRNDSTNDIDADVARKYFDLDDECETEILTLQIANMNAQGEVRERQKRNFKMGVADGLPKAAFKLELKRHRLEAKHARQTANLVDNEEEDIVELADLIREKLGAFSDSPLGAHAVGEAEAKLAKRRREKSNALDDLAARNDSDDADLGPRHLREAEAERVAENAKAIEGGIKALN